MDLDFGSLGRLLVRDKEPRFGFSEGGVGTDLGPARNGSAAAFRRVAPQESAGIAIQGGTFSQHATQPMPTPLPEPAAAPRAVPAMQLDQAALQMKQASAAQGNGGWRNDDPPS